MLRDLVIIGAGLAGSEAAWQAAQRGIRVLLYEMRPVKMTEAHQTGLCGELVCSNSLRSDAPASGPGLLKQELSAAGSLIMAAARATAVPAGSSLAVDRKLFAEHITKALEGHPNVRILHEECLSLPDAMTILATGPLTSEAMSRALADVIGGEYLYFYDAIAPIIEAMSIDMKTVFRASRYGKGGDDYLNCPMNREEYDRFYHGLTEADTLEARSFEDKKFFEGCMPVEVMAERGIDTLRFGPMKPVGLKDPRNGATPYAVVQLRPENRESTAYNMVGFQTRLKWPEQQRVFRMIPGLERAEFLRYGSIHRNTFVNGPSLLNPDLTMKKRPSLYLAGQITGVEGYIESTAMGLLAGINAAHALKGTSVGPPPPDTAHGALVRHICESTPDGFQPSNINFGLFPADEAAARVRNRAQRREMIAAKALSAWRHWLEAESKA